MFFSKSPLYHPITSCLVSNNRLRAKTCHPHKKVIKYKKRKKNIANMFFSKSPFYHPITSCLVSNTCNRLRAKTCLGNNVLV